jgi:hypothetical protein
MITVLMGAPAQEKQPGLRETCQVMSTFIQLNW